MSTNKLFTRGFAALFSLFLALGVVFGQGNLVITTSSVFSGTGTTVVKKNIVNTTAGSAKTITGTVQLAGTTQSIGGGASAINFEALDATAAGTKTFTVNSDISTRIDITVPGATVFDIGSKTLRLLGTGANTIKNTGGATVGANAPYNFSAGTVDYAADADQTVWGTAYATLITSGTSATPRAKTPGANVSVATTFTNGANATVDFTSHSFTFSGLANAFTNASNGTLRSAGVVSITTQTTIGGLFEYNAGTPGQNVADAQYFNLTLSGGGTKNIAASVVTAVSGAYDIAASGVRTYGAGSTFKYNATGGSTSQSVAPDTYVNLELDGTNETDVKTASGNLATTGTFTNTLAKLVMASNSLTIGSGNGSNSGRIAFAGGSNGRPVGSGAGVVEYNGTGSQTVATGTYFNLEFTNGTVGVAEKTIGAAVTADGYVTINAGGFVTVTSSLSVPNQDLTVNGSLTNNGTVTVGN